MKQMIEIDVPDGYEFSSEFQGTDENGNFAERIIVILKKKEPKYIEVREYLYVNLVGDSLVGVHNRMGLPDDERLPRGAIRWLGDWRKVEI